MMMEVERVNSQQDLTEEADGSNSTKLKGKGEKVKNLCV